MGPHSLTTPGARYSRRPVLVEDAEARRRDELFHGTVVFSFDTCVIPFARKPSKIQVTSVPVLDRSP